MSNLPNIVAIGNIYVETNYFGIGAESPDSLRIGKEYRATSYEVRLAGSAANFAVQMARFGEHPALVGKVGSDSYGQKLIDLARGASIDPVGIVVDPDPSVRTSIDAGLVLAANGQNIQIVAGNANQNLRLEDIDLEHPLYKSCELVYLGGFLKQESLFSDYPVLLSKLRSMRIPVFLDHGRLPIDMSQEKRFVLLSCLPYVTGYFPNLDELLAISMCTDVEAALQWAIHQGVTIAAVKMGNLGCMVKQGETLIKVHAYDIHPVNTVGAGDAFNAGFIFEYLNNSDLQKCAEFANATAAYKVSTNHHPDLPKVRQFMEEKVLF
jgi:sugar/nucleoside kinase (ribokinase family)